MQDLECEHIYRESTKDTTERPWLKYIMERAQEGDTIVFHKLSNALANTVELTNLARLCVGRSIRIVSVQDHIDSQRKYYEPTYNDFFVMLSTFSKESYNTKHKFKKLHEPPDSVIKIQEQRLKREREAKIINMYMSECTYQQIMDELNIKTRRTIANVLNRNHISLDRHKYDRKGYTQVLNPETR